MTKVSENIHGNWRQWQFWRDMFLYFWFFSLFGHIVEIFWALLGLATGFRTDPLGLIPLFAIAVPYGLGAVALLLSLYPLVQKKRIGPIAAFVIGGLMTTGVEFICAALIVVFLGSNPFWDYSDQFMNLYGYVCLVNGVLFGVGSVALLWWIFPHTEKVFVRTSKRHLDIAFWILFISYILSQIYLRILRH